MCFEELKRTQLNELLIENLKCLVMNSNGICVVN